MMRSVRRPKQSEPGPAGSHKTALKKFLSVSELALDREMAATYMIGPFRLDAETDTLFRGSEPVSLGHRAVALLRVLVERRGIPVSKDALMEAAWAGLTVEESNLAVQIAALRRVFGKEAGGEIWIKPFPRRAYRLVGRPPLGKTKVPLPQRRRPRIFPWPPVPRTPRF